MRYIPIGKQQIKPLNQNSFPAWFSPGGAASLFLAVLAIAQASLFGSRWLTLVLSLLGMSIAVGGAWITRRKQQRRDQVWFASSGALSVIILLLLLFAPGFLNIRWAIDKAVPKPDPNHLTVVPIDKRMQKGRPLQPNETVDAATEALRQDYLVISVESAKIGRLTGEGSPHLLVQCRIVNLGQSESISLEGFISLPPVLTDGSNRPCPFLEQRLKEIRNRSVLYVEWDPHNPSKSLLEERI